MPFSIPNIGDAAFDAQSEPDSVDLDILAAAIAGNGVLSGGDVSAQGTPDMTVAVAGGSVSVNGVLRILAEDPALSLSAAHSTLDRFDLIVASPDGLGGYVPAVIEGVESDAPVFAAFDPSTGGATPVDGDVVLAAVYVPAGETAIEDANIVDKRSAPQAAADVTVDDTDMGVSGDNVQELVGSIDSALTAVQGDVAAVQGDLTAVQGDVADRLPLAGGVMDLDSTVRLGEWPGTTWHDTHQPVSFTEEPTLVFPIESGVLLGVFATANHFALARSIDGGTSWTAFTTWDFITGQTAVALYRFLNDTDFNTGFVNYDNLGIGPTFADRIGVGLGTDFTDVGTIDNAATSKIRWWFGTTGGHHLVPGRDLLYDLGEAARKVREVFAGTGTFSSALTVGGDAVATESYVDSLLPVNAADVAVDDSLFSAFLAGATDAQAALAALDLHDHDGFYDPIGAAAAAVGLHAAAANPHPDYALESSLGDAATKDVGTAAGTVAAGDHNHSGVYEAVGVAAALVDDLSGVSDASTARTNLGLGSLATLSAVGSAQITDGSIVAGDLSASAAVALSQLATQATGTFVGNVSGSTAVPSAVSAASTLAALSGVAAAAFSFNAQDVTAGRLGVNASAWSTVEKLRVNTPTTADTAANVMLSASATTAKPLVVQMAPSQTANGFELQTSAGGVVASLGSTGNLRIGSGSSGVLNMPGGSGQNRPVLTYNAAYEILDIGANGFTSLMKLSAVGLLGVGANVTPGAQLHVKDGSASRIGAIVQGAASQTANIQEWQNSTGTVLASVTAAGALTLQQPAATTGTIFNVYDTTNARDAVTLETFTQYGGMYPKLTLKGTVGTGGIGGQLAIRSAGDAVFDFVSETRVATFNSVVNARFEPYGAAGIGLQIRGKSAQTGDLLRFTNSSATVLAAVTAAGLHKWSSGNEQTTVGAAGAASALPATPTKFLKVVDSGGTTLVVPAYAAS